IDDYHDEIAEQVFKMFSRRTVALTQLKIRRVGMNLIKESPFGCLLQYTSDACGIKTFRELRAMCRPRVYRDFIDARRFVRGLSLESAEEWRVYCSSGEKPEDVPSNPNVAYEGEGWAGFPDWLGTARTTTFRPFGEAREFVRSLGIQSQTQWG